MTSDDVSPALPPPCPPLPEQPPPPPAGIDEQLFPGFRRLSIDTGGTTIHTLVGGGGPPVLLLHGHPQTHVAWHKVAGRLATRFTVAVTDLRGYGDSGKPDGGPDHGQYAPRAMAHDQVEVMHHLGFERFAVAGHDRGGRVAHRMALDHPDRVSKLAVLDIAPTLTMYQRTDRAFATAYVWWFFQIQPFPMPEHLIGLDPTFYLRQHLDVQNKTPGAVTRTALAEYLRCYCAARTIHAACEDYRAAAGIGLELDAADDRAGRRVTAPLLALWGSKGVVGRLYDVLATWRDKAADARGHALDCGHLLPEERPEETSAELMAFFEGASTLARYPT
jgi:haloacetate dehalogenase